ncbi:MAG TPA: amidohydrolase family protein [Acidimicrobiales bacterium]|nr:amidohydrolase family protein [Acidimicrobiales bacterium]
MTTPTSPFPGVPVVDADGHILEPRDLWERELPAKFRDATIKVTWNEATQTEDEWVNGALLFPGLATTNGWARLPRSVRDNPVGLRWEDLTPAGLHGKDRVAELDREGIDVAVLYPSLGLGIGGLTDPEHAVLACRIYNDWLASYCAEGPGRLIGIGAIPMQDPAAAAREAERCVRELQFRGVVIRPNPCGELFAHDRAYDPLWEVLQGLGVPAGFHPAGFPDTFGAAQTYGPLWRGMTPLGKVLNFMIDVVTTFTMLIASGTLDRFPSLKLIVLESGVGWLPWWLDKMDHWNEARLPGPSIELRPSDYVRRQVWVSGDPDETSFPLAAQVAPADRLVWASDFPHLDILESEPSATAELYEHLGALPAAVAEGILGRNACELYGL